MHEKIIELQAKIKQCQQPRSASPDRLRSTGCDAIDRLLPAQGIRTGSLTQWIGDGIASGAGTVSLITAWKVCQAGLPLIMIDDRHRVSPVAFAAMGLDLRRIVIIRPTSSRDALWACEQALRCSEVGLVWASLNRLSGQAFRRLQLAVEQSDGLGFIVQGPAALREPSWAEVRLSVTPKPPGGQKPCIEITSCKSHQSKRTRSHPEPHFEVKVVGGKSVRPVSTATIKIDSQRGTLDEVQQTNNANALSLVS